MENILNYKWRKGVKEVFPAHPMVQNWLFTEDTEAEAMLAHQMDEDSDDLFFECTFNTIEFNLQAEFHNGILVIFSGWIDEQFSDHSEELHAEYHNNEWIGSLLEESIVGIIFQTIEWAKERDNKIKLFRKKLSSIFELIETDDDLEMVSKIFDELKDEQ